MTVETLAELLGWSLVINLAVLVLSTLGIITLRRTIASFHARIFGLEERDVGRAYFQYLAQYKIAVMVLNLAPYLALKIIA